MDFLFSETYNYFEVKIMKQALVLAGGGAKGAYQAGCIKALKDLNYDFDIVTGTSIGALNGLLVVQQDYQALYQLWDQMKVSDVFKDPVNFDFSIESLLSQTNLIKPFFKSYLNEKGADITPLKNMIYHLYDDQKAKNSKIDYGIVTVKYPNLAPIEITKKEMTEAKLVEYALASASCFPAFPVHYINKQGYIDGGYFDNLPISLALKMKADKIIVIDLKQEVIHPHFLNRPNITIIRPSYDLGGFLDFNREILDWRIKLGYYDTLKTFNQLDGYLYNFKKTELNQDRINKIYHLILNYEDEINRNIVNKTLSYNTTPITDLLKKDTYLNTLEIEDYFIRSLEITMARYNYQSDLLYEIDQVCKELLKTFLKEYQNRYHLLENRFRDIPIKEIFSTIKTLGSKDAICVFYHSLKNQESIEPGLISNIFLPEYLIALFLYTISN